MESGVLDGINSNSNHLPTPGQPHVDWSIGVGVRFSSPPNLSVVVGRQISNDIDAGRYGAAGRGDEDGGYLRSPDPQIRQKFCLDAGVLGESRADQPRYVGTMSVDLVVHRLAFVINNLETPNSPASSTAVQHWGAPSRFRGSSKQPTFQTDSRHGRGSETCAHLETAPPPPANTKKEGKTTPKKHHSISVLTTLPRLIPSNINHTRSQESGLPFLRVAAPPSPPPPPAPPGVLEKKLPNNPLFFFPSTHPPTHPQCPQLPTQRSTQHAGSPARRASGFGTLPPLPRPRPGSPFPFLFLASNPSRRRRRRRQTHPPSPPGSIPSHAFMTVVTAVSTPSARLSSKKKSDSSPTSPTVTRHAGSGVCCAQDDRESCLEMDLLRPVWESLLVSAVIATGQCLARVGWR